MAFFFAKGSNIMKGPIEDLTDKQFGRLKVIRKVETSTPQNKTFWLCKCSCGLLKSIPHHNLTNHKTLSCGCLKKENYHKYNKDIPH